MQPFKKYAMQRRDVQKQGNWPKSGSDIIVFVILDTVVNTNICKNGGSCYDDAGAQFCTCASGFGGELCERTLEQPHIESDDGRIASLSLACWILALSFCLSLCFGIMGWIFYRKERHDSKELREEVKRLQNELKMQTSKHNLITKRIRTKPEERKLLSKEVP
ncbi:unnamed protein product [Bursaphelenchus xylophilus]|uniref:(pine wood nematode) hypothetical protein n=1 Tax=Bursaphelenchus xylophilus TaxID=6326 RepID=A0A7I8WTT8_BURXY|nr:unnamed protein product [Bursaphelenchus xylophilus]CAG9116125.1 unnamed protein product [Bursaphelenchus xylophilus]